MKMKPTHTHPANPPSQNEAQVNHAHRSIPSNAAFRAAGAKPGSGPAPAGDARKAYPSEPKRV